VEQRTEWIDYTKALGIMLVVYAHVARGLYNAGISIPRQFYELTDSVIYSFVMPLFFFLSGLFFYRSFTKRGASGLVLSKVDTILYPYILWSLIQGVIEATLSTYTNSDVTYAEVFSLLWSPRAQFWFLYTLFIFFLLSSAIYFVASQNVSKAALKKLSVLIFLLSAIAYLTPSIRPEGFIFDVIPQHFVFFAFGIVFSLYLDAQQLSRWWAIALLAVAAGAVQYYYHVTLDQRYTDYGPVGLLAALVSILFMVAISTRLSERPNRLMLFIGTSSMAIYLMHILAGSGARVVLKALIGTDAYIAHLLLGFAVGLFVPLMTVWVIERYRIPYVFSAPIRGGLAAVRRG
jgi:fucose 4-O-acetylase-like acetyltransferase